MRRMSLASVRRMDILSNVDFQLVRYHEQYYNVR